MKAEKIYLLPVKKASIAAKRMFGMLLATGLLLLTMPAMAQYYNVSHTSGTLSIGGRNVTVTNVNGSTVSNCGYAPYKEGNGGPGSYTWTFSSGVVAIRTHITAIGPSDTVSILINGVAYPLSAGQVNPLPVACTGNTAVVAGGKIVTSGGNSDATVDINTGSAITSVTIMSSGPSGVVASDFNFEPVLNMVPSFTAGSVTALAVCQDATSKDISGSLSITDNDNAQTETWTVTSAPAHGTLGGFPHSGTSNGGVVTVPANTFTYQPATGFNGADSFIIRINDGTDTADVLVRMTVNPTPDVTVSSSQTKCNNTATDSVYFLGSVAGTIFSWANDDNSTGLAFNGTGDIPSFVATNVTFSPVVSTVTVTPTFAGCPGSPKIFTITVNPTPDVYVPTNAFNCTGDLITLAGFASDEASVSYAWSNSNTTVGLATSGTGNIIPFTAQNTGTANNTATVTVTPSANGCAGFAQPFTITVYPVPMLTSAVVNKTCDSADFHYVPTSATTGVTYAWERTAVGGVANGTQSGADSVDEYLDNTGTTIVPAIYTFTLTANGCTNVQNVTDTVIPTLLLSSAHVAPAVCNNTTFNYVPMSPTSGVTFQWNRNPVYGISNNGSTNSFNPLENLIDTTSAPVVVTYNYNVIYAACANEYDVKVTVNPTGKLTTTHTPVAICDSTMFTYGSASSVTGTTTTFSWSRRVQPNISDTANSGVDTIKEVLVNTDANPTRVVYIDTLTAYGCQSIDSIAVYVNPKPVLSSNHIAAVCSGAPFTYVHASNTLGATFAWSRAAVTGISNPAASDTGNIHETLVNPDTAQHIAIYIDTLTINGCKNTDTIRVTVNPIPKLKSTHTPAAICNKQIFSYVPTSATVNSTFDWSRAYVPGIDILSSTGSDNPLEQLINTTNFDRAVVYVYTLTANGCQKKDDTVTVVVHPTLTLSSSDSVVTCSHAPFAYQPTSYISAVSFKWTRAQIQGIYPATAKDSGVIKEVLVDTATFPIYTTYKYKLTLDACTDSENLVVRVDPAPYTPQISIKTPDALCANTHYQNFGAATAPPAGSSYAWSAVNATVMATGNNKQNALVSFNNAGAAQVIVTSSIAVTGCRIADTFNVNVGTSLSDNPNVIYYNGQFMCLQNNVKTYQWGYDDVLSLDSTLYAGEVNQVYFNSNPDLTYKYYWVITTNSGGCMQKSYYNVPLGVVNVNATDASIKVYPNPASSNINVEINTAVSGDIQVEVLNLVGQRVSTTTTTDRRAMINVSDLATGCYLLNCYHEGVKIATTKFIKN